MSLSGVFCFVILEIGEIVEGSVGASDFGSIKNAEAISNL